MIFNDGIGAWGIDDRDRLQNIHRQRLLDQVLAEPGLGALGSVVELLDDRGARTGVHGADALPQEGVDEAALAGLDLADDDKAERLAEVLHLPEDDLGDIVIIQADNQLVY